MKSSRRAKNMEDSNTMRRAQAHSSQLSALESALSQTGMSELRHEIVAACKEYRG
jgi:DNA-binding transcriptional regulator WhiA